MSSKKKNQFKPLNRKSLTEFSGAERREKFNGPGAYDLIDDPKRVKTFSISHAPRFAEKEKEPNDKKRKCDEAFREELKKKFKDKGLPDTAPQHVDVLYRGIECPTKAANFSLSHQPRFDWQHQQELDEMRSKRKGVGEPENRNSPERNKAGSELNVDKAYLFVQAKTLSPIIRPPTKDESADEKKKPLSREELEHLAAIEIHGTIYGFIKSSKGGDFSKGPERNFELGVQLSAPEAIYEPNIEAIKPHVAVPVFFSAAPDENNNQSKRQLRVSEKGLKLQALQKKYEEDVLKAADRALQQVDKISTHKRTPGVVMCTAPISANMPLSYNEGNFWNSRSMRAQLCDTEGLRIECEALGTSAAQKWNSSSAKTRKSKRTPKKQIGPQSEGSTTTGEEGADSSNVSTSKRKLFAATPDPTLHNTSALSSSIIHDGFQSPFSRRTPQPTTKISLTSPIFDLLGSATTSSSNTNSSSLIGSSAKDDAERLREQVTFLAKRRALASGNITRHLIHHFLPQDQQERLKYYYHDDEQQRKQSREPAEQTAATPESHNAVGDASIFSDGTSPALVYLPKNSTKSDHNIKPHWNPAGKGNSSEKPIPSGIPLAALIAKRTR